MSDQERAYIAQRYRQAKKRLKITDADVAQMFGYSNAASFANSPGKPKVEQGVVLLLDRINEIQSDFLDLSKDYNLSKTHQPNATTDSPNDD